MSNNNRNICFVFANFGEANNLREKISLKKFKTIMKVQVSTICLSQKRSNTYNRSIENEMVIKNILVKSKIRFS